MPETQLSLASNAAELKRLIRTANKFIHSAKAPATLRAYKSDWRNFETWCHKHRLTPLPATPQTIALYMADSAATVKSGTITRRLTSITKAHQAAGFADSPASTRHMVVGETLKGIPHHRNRTERKGSTSYRRHSEDRRRLPVYSHWPSRQGSHIGWFRRRLPKVRACSNPAPRTHLRQERRDRRSADVENRSGRRGPKGGSAFWFAPGNLPGACAAGVACCGRYQGRSCFPLREPSWESRERRPLSRLDRTDSEAGRQAGAHEDEADRRSQSSFRHGHAGRDERRERVHHHEADRASHGGDTGALCEVRADLHRERSGQHRHIKAAYRVHPIGPI